MISIGIYVRGWCIRQARINNINITDDLLPSEFDPRKKGFQRNQKIVPEIEGHVRHPIHQQQLCLLLGYLVEDLGVTARDDCIVGAMQDEDGDLDQFDDLVVLESLFDEVGCDCPVFVLYEFADGEKGRYQHDPSDLELTDEGEGGAASDRSANDENVLEGQAHSHQVVHHDDDVLLDFVCGWRAFVDGVPFVLHGEHGVAGCTVDVLEELGCGFDVLGVPVEIEDELLAARQEQARDISPNLRARFGFRGKRLNQALLLVQHRQRLHLHRRHRTPHRRHPPLLVEFLK